MTQFCFVNTKKKETPIEVVIKALLKQERMQQIDLADILETTPANLSQRLKAGRMTAEMHKRIDEHFNINTFELVRRYEEGESLESILQNLNPSAKRAIDVELSPDEVKEIVANQGKTMKELQNQLDQLMGQIKTWIQHDIEKSMKQEQLINTLLEERAEYKSKK